MPTGGVGGRIDLDSYFGIIVKPRYFIVPWPIDLQKMLDILGQIAQARALMIAGTFVVPLRSAPLSSRRNGQQFAQLNQGIIRDAPLDGDAARRHSHLPFLNLGAVDHGQIG